MHKFYKKTILRFLTAIMPLKGAIFFSLFIFGIGLLFLNLIGVSTTLRNPDIMQEPLKDKFDLEFSLERFYAELDLLSKNKNLNDSNKIVQATYLVNRSMAHYWTYENSAKYNVEIPIYENYILFLIGKLSPKWYSKYEFCDWKRAIERGVGLCSQHVIVQVGVLNKIGIQCQAIGLFGHVVLTAEYNKNKWIVADPDYGVVLPFHIDSIGSNPSVIAQFYEKEGYDSLTIKKLEKIYGQANYFITSNYCGERKLIEERAYVLIWILPFVLLIPFIYLFIENKYWEKGLP